MKMANGHCWSWAVSTCVFNLQFFLLSFMFESTYNKKLNKNKNKNPILAHGPWRVFGPVMPKLESRRPWWWLPFWSWRNLVLSAQSWSLCFSFVKGLLTVPTDSAEKGSGSWVQYPCCHPPATRPWPLWVPTSLCITRTIIAPDS